MLVARILTALALPVARHLHHHHRLLADVRFNTHTQSIEPLAVAKQPLQLLHAVKLLFVVEALHLHRLHRLHHHLPLVHVTM